MLRYLLDMFDDIDRNAHLHRLPADHNMPRPSPLATLTLVVPISLKHLVPSPLPATGDTSDLTPKSYDQEDEYDPDISLEFECDGGYI